MLQVTDILQLLLAPNVNVLDINLHELLYSLLFSYYSLSAPSAYSESSSIQIYRVIQKDGLTS